MAKTKTPKVAETAAQAEINTQAVEVASTQVQTEMKEDTQMTTETITQEVQAKTIFNIVEDKLNEFQITFKANSNEVLAELAELKEKVKASTQEQVLAGAEMEKIQLLVELNNKIKTFEEKVKYHVEQSQVLDKVFSNNEYFDEKTKKMLSKYSVSEIVNALINNGIVSKKNISGNIRQETIEKFQEVILEVAQWDKKEDVVYIRQLKGLSNLMNGLDNITHVKSKEYKIEDNQIVLNEVDNEDEAETEYVFSFMGKEAKFTQKGGVVNTEWVDTQFQINTRHGLGVLADKNKFVNKYNNILAFAKSIKEEQDVSKQFQMLKAEKAITLNMSYKSLTETEILSTAVAILVKIADKEVELNA